MKLKIDTLDSWILEKSKEHIVNLFLYYCGHGCMRTIVPYKPKSENIRNNQMEKRGGLSS